MGVFWALKWFVDGCFLVTSSQCEELEVWTTHSRNRSHWAFWSASTISYTIPPFDNRPFWKVVLMVVYDDSKCHKQTKIQYKSTSPVGGDRGREFSRYDARGQNCSHWVCIHFPSPFWRWDDMCSFLLMIHPKLWFSNTTQLQKDFIKISVAKPSMLFANWMGSCLNVWLWYFPSEPTGMTVTCSIPPSSCFGALALSVRVFAGCILFRKSCLYEALINSIELHRLLSLIVVV